MFLLGIRIEEWDLRCIKKKKSLLFGCHWVDCDVVRCNCYNDLYNHSGSNILMTTDFSLYQNHSFDLKLKMIFIFKLGTLLKTVAAKRKT